ncbi:MAG: hypothetical protein GY714_02375 [Desulfobacterales bacterium]|nr:hypothetical protein [Desulfobacterales bacterium]MCP4163613.1 hypothetical protein [Deltaproteobacteria bacterium]
MKKLILTLIIAVAMLTNVQANGTMVFAKKAITKRNEDKVNKKNRFSKRDSIYARAYLSEKIGPFSKESKNNIIYSDDFIAELHIDGKLKYTWRSLKNSKIIDNQEFQFCIYRTGSRPDFPLAKFKRLSRGKHRVRIVAFRSRVNEKKVLAEGEFTFFK